MADPVRLHEQIACYTQGGRSYYRCNACGKDFVSFPQGMEIGGWLGHRINRRFQEHARERHPATGVGPARPD